MNALIGDTKRQSRYPRAQRADPALIPRAHATHLQLLIHIADPASTPYSPHTDRRPCTHPSHLHSPCTHHYTPRTPHTHLTRPAPTLQTPRSPCIHPTHLVDSGSTPHTWHIAQTPHPSHTHTHTRPCSHHAHTPHSARAHRRLRVRRARSQRSRSLCPLSPSLPGRAAPAGRGGCAALLRPGTRQGGAQAAEAAVANSSRPCAGPGAHRRPPDPCRLCRALPGTPRPPPGAMPPASPAACRRLSLHSPLAAIFPQRSSR